MTGRSNAGNTFDITGTNAGNVGAITSFTAFQNLNGGSGTSNNAFVFSNAASVSGNINGVSTGTNTLNYSAYTTAVSVNLQSTTATGIGGTYSNINTLIGGVVGLIRLRVRTRAIHLISLAPTLVMLAVSPASLPSKT